MCIIPSRGEELKIKGFFEFSAQPINGIEIRDTYELEITIPNGFPKDIPEVKEVGRKIPRNAMYHINIDDTLCLGSPIRLLKKISQHPNLSGFTETCLIPYLYAVSYKLKFGGEFIFGELAHDKPGIIDDYLNLFGLKYPEQVIETLVLLGIKKRVANKAPCPCSCGLRLGKCRFRYKVNELRKMANRSWFRNHVKYLI
jgi:hypothetical protein